MSDSPALADYDPLLLAGFVGILTYSFFVSLHCVAMCSPLVCARLGPRTTWRSPGLWLYNSGRLLSYTMMGALAGLVGQSFFSISGSVGSVVSRFLALALVLWGASLWIPALAANGNQWGVLLQDRFLRLLPAAGAGKGDFSLGLLTVFLPCMTLGPALLTSITMASALQGSLLMLAFFLGTLPAMVVGPALQTFVLRGRGQIWTGRIAGSFLILAGVITWLRG